MKDLRQTIRNPALSAARLAGVALEELANDGDLVEVSRT